MEVGSSASSYEILAKLAEGGMAEIFLARSKTGAGVERLVVLKRVLRRAAMDEDLVKLFIGEARLAAQLQHPNVVQVFDVGKLGSSYFFSMEYVHGETVRDLMLVARHKRIQLPVAVVLTIAAGAAAGLSHAHDRRGLNGKPLNIVHADMSPSNLMITYDGVVKVVDFGIAKAEHQTSEVTIELQGKLCYMSPEQVRSKPLDRRSDLFSLGILLWELLTLQGLFRADSDFNVMNMIITEPMPPPSQVRRDVPLEVDDIVMRLLAKDPVDRFQSAAELLEAIETAMMRLGMLHSTATVARHMREWFGEKDEPWIEQTVGGSVKRVVVNSEPVPASFNMTIAGPMNEPADDILDRLEPEQPKAPASQGAPAWDNPTLEGATAMRRRLIKQLNERRPRHPTGDPAFISDDAATIMDPPRITLMTAGPDRAGYPGAAAARAPAPAAPARAPAPAAPARGPAAAARTSASPARADADTPRVPVPAVRATTLPPHQPSQESRPAQPAQRPVAPAVAPRTAPRADDTPATGGRARNPTGFPRADSKSEGTSRVLLVLLALGITVGIGGTGFFILWKTQLAGSGPKVNPTIDRKFAAADYVGALTACLDATPASTQLATCAIAACAVSDAFHAKRWREMATETERPDITATCHKHGTELDAPAK